MHIHMHMQQRIYVESRLPCMGLTSEPIPWSAFFQDPACVHALLLEVMYWEVMGTVATSCFLTTHHSTPFACAD